MSKVSHHTHISRTHGYLLGSGITEQISYLGVIIL